MKDTTSTTLKELLSALDEPFRRWREILKGGPLPDLCFMKRERATAFYEKALPSLLEAYVRSPRRSVAHDILDPLLTRIMWQREECEQFRNRSGTRVEWGDHLLPMLVRRLLTAAQFFAEKDEVLPPGLDWRTVISALARFKAYRDETTIREVEAVFYAIPDTAPKVRKRNACSEVWPWPQKEAPMPEVARHLEKLLGIPGRTVRDWLKGQTIQKDMREKPLYVPKARLLAILEKHKYL